MFLSLSTVGLLGRCEAAIIGHKPSETTRAKNHSRDLERERERYHQHDVIHSNSKSSTVTGFLCTTFHMENEKTYQLVLLSFLPIYRCLLHVFFLNRLLSFLFCSFSAEPLRTFTPRGSEHVDPHHLKHLDSCAICSPKRFEDLPGILFDSF